MMPDEGVSALASPLPMDACSRSETQLLEERVAAMVGAPAALALNSPMAALLTALLALDVGAGDGIIASPLGCCNVVNAIEQVGARPILVDVEPETLTMDARQAEETLSRCAELPVIQPRAIMPTHYAGHPADLERLTRLASEYRLAVVEDAAQALGAMCHDDYIGRVAEGDSQRAVCSAGTDDDGACERSGGFLTGTADLIARARLISHHGWRVIDQSSDGRRTLLSHQIVYPGFDFHMTEVQATSVLAEMSGWSMRQAQRAAIAARYCSVFGDVGALRVPMEQPGVVAAWRMYVLRLNMECFRLSAVGGRRDAFRDHFVAELNARHVKARCPLAPIHLHPYYRDKYGYHPDDFPVAYGEYRRMVLLPADVDMTHEQVDRAIEAVLDVTQRYRR